MLSCSRKGGRGGCRSGKWWLINAYGECMHTYMLMRSQNRQWRQYLRLLRPPAEEAAPLLQEEVAGRCMASSDSPLYKRAYYDDETPLLQWKGVDIATGKY